MCPTLRSLLLRLLPSLVLTGGTSCLLAFGQGPGGSSGSSQLSAMQRLTLVVSVRETNGQPLGVQAIVRVSTDLSGQNVMDVTREGAIASFPNMYGGDYMVEVEAAGYKTAHERAELVGGSSTTIYVYMTPEGATEAVGAVDQRQVMSPKLQKEVHRALAAIREKKYPEARQRLLAASKMSPANPEIEYLFGMVDYLEKRPEPAAAHFEKALSLAPKHERALVSLGRLQLEAHEYQKSAVHLESAIQNNTKNAQAHLLLAICYVGLQSFSKARVEALAAADLDKTRAAAGRLIAAKTHLMENNLEEANKAFTSFLHDFPDDKAGPEAKEILEKISKSSAPDISRSPGDILASQPQPVVVIENIWAPPDTDEKIPTVAPDVACSTDEVVTRASGRSQLALTNFERFGAMERIDHQAIDSQGNPGPIKSRNFSYTILIQHPNQKYYFVDERRDGDESLYSFPSSLATKGLVSIGVNILHPLFSNDMNFSCEGLGNWAGRPAWQVHFVQKPDTVSKIRSWSYRGKIYPVALKGRVWISPNTFDVIHLETDLRDPVRELQLTKEHLAIDYGPITFKQVKEVLWLPQNAEMYFSFLGKRYHHRHTLSDYVLFSVEEKSKIGTPVQPTAEQ